MGWESTADKLVEKLPYSDGAARRRFIAGAMLVAGVAVPYWSIISRPVAGLSIGDLIKTPLVAAACGLLVYVTGTLVEMIGAVFLVPTALLLFRALRLSQPGVDRRMLSQDANRLVDELPSTIQIGLTQPTGKYADLTSQHLASAFADPRRRRWCRRLFSRVSDVATTTTALICIISPFVVVRTLRSTSAVDETHYWTDLSSVTQTFERLRNDKSYLLVWQLVDALRHLKKAPAPGSSLAALAETDLYVHLPDTQWSSIDRFVDYVKQRKTGQRLSYLSPDVIDQVRIAFVALRHATEEQARRLSSVSNEIASGVADEQDRGLKQLALTVVAQGERETERRLTFLNDLPDEAERWQATADRVQTHRAERTTLIIFGSILLPGLLLLYAGYFMSLRNAVVNALEALAIECLTNPEQLTSVFSETQPDMTKQNSLTTRY